MQRFAVCATALALTAAVSACAHTETADVRADSAPQAVAAAQPAVVAPVALQGPEPTPASVRTVAPSGDDDYVAAHNRYRAQHCAPALSRSADLERSAQAHADRLAVMGGLQHSDGPYGENLYFYGGTAGGAANPYADAAQAWYDEMADYDFARGQSANGGVIGHFTQLVWEGSTEVGCAVAAGRQGAMTTTTVVCQYAPAGNMIGAYTQNVSPPCQ